LKRIAQILLSPRIGGAETLATSLEQEWRSRGIESHIVYLDQKGEEKSRVRRASQLRRTLRALAPEAVVAHSYLPALYARAVWGSHAPVHSVLHSASDDFASKRSQFVERTLASKTASVVTVSDEQAHAYRSRFPNVRVTRIANGVSEAVDSRTSFRDAPHRIVTIARIAEQKRPDYWDAVVREMHRRRPELVFEWWGPLSGDHSLDRYVLDGCSAARYMGETTHPSAVLRNADILFHPSAREAHSIALLEGAVAGLPVVYADSIAKPDTDPVWAWRYDGGSAAGAVTVLEQTIDNWVSVAGAAVAFAHQARARYGMADVANKYLSWMAAGKN
jgi:Glycosyltransferase